MTHQKIEGERTLMRIHIGESDKWHGKPLHEAIVDCCGKTGFSGRDRAGAGGGIWLFERISPPTNTAISQDLPIILEVIETQERN